MPGRNSDAATGAGIAHRTDSTAARSTTFVGRVQAIGAILLALGMYYAVQAVTDRIAFGAAPPAPGSGWSSADAFAHHFWQLVLALVLIAGLAGRSWRAWGLNLRNHRASLRILREFLVVYGVYFVGIGFLIQLLFLGAPEPAHPMTAGAIAGRLAFGFFFVGLSEEVLFRGLIHTFLARYWRGIRRWRGWEIPTAGLITAVIFTMAHIGFSVGQLTITHLSWPQLLMALVLGIFYSVAYHRTGSLLAPVLAHNFSDGALWSSEYLLFWITGG